MHEMSIVKSLLAQVQRVVSENGGQAAQEIVVEIGPLSGVEVELVKSAFARLVETDAIKLTVHEVPMVIRCRVCNNEQGLRRFVFRCPVCNSGRVQVIRGDEFRLVSVTVVETESYVE